VKYSRLARDNAHYHRYSVPGIKVYEAIRCSVESFVNAVSRKPDPTLSLDRKNPSRHYSCGKCDECVANNWPPNCRWATDATQGANRRDSVAITIGRESKTLAEWQQSTVYHTAAQHTVSVYSAGNRSPP
jgi:hypothetical protein